MNVSLQHLIKAIVNSLEGEVLPHLDPQAKPASNVRACLMVLANIESRITYEPKLLFDDNRELHALLEDAAKNAEQLDLDEGVRRALAGALKQYPGQQAFYDPALAAQENRDLQEVLTQVINRLSSAEGDKAEFRGKLHRYLDETGKREMALVQTALTRVPV